MPLSQRMGLRTSQSPVMTPQMQQAIRMLQLSNLELGAYLDAELLCNPLIERDDSAIDETDSGSTGVRLAERPTLAGGDGRASARGGRDGPRSGPLRDSAAALRGPVSHGPVWRRPDSTGHGAEAADLVAAEKTLRQHLYDQLGVEITDPGERIIGACLIELIEETGYLADDTGRIATMLGCSPDRIDAVLRRLQDFDPPGMFARNLAECLALQLKERDRLDPAMQALLDNLDRLADGDLGELRRLCGVDEEDLRDMAAEIRALDPKPGLSFETEPQQATLPDILMREGLDSGWIVELNPESLPRILVNNSYYAEIGERSKLQSDRDYLDECYQSAHWLVRSMHQRATTILRVAREIVRQQDAFFRHGVQYLKPLVLRDIAESVGLHESTVSRVTSNKSIATPRGLLELKYFFTSGIASTSGGGPLSAESVRSRIRLLIDQESPDQVLSDDRLVEILQGQGVAIARRTVAKYREAMRIPSSFRRRRRKRQSL